MQRRCIAFRVSETWDKTVFGSTGIIQRLRSWERERWWDKMRWDEIQYANNYYESWTFQEEKTNMFECTTFPVALAGHHKVSLHLGDVQLREFCYSQITFFERFWRLEKTSCLFSLFVSCLFQNRLAMKLKVKKICSQDPHRDALPWWSQCMVSSDATNRKTSKWDCQIGRWRFASASTNSLCYLSISFTFIYFSPWPTTGGEANNAAISCVPGDEKGSEQKLTKCWCVLMHIIIYYWESRI